MSESDGNVFDQDGNSVPPRAGSDKAIHVDSSGSAEVNPNASKGLATRGARGLEPKLNTIHVEAGSVGPREPIDVTPPADAKPAGGAPTDTTVDADFEEVSEDKKPSKKKSSKKKKSKKPKADTPKADTPKMNSQEARDVMANPNGATLEQKEEANKILKADEELTERADKIQARADAAEKEKFDKTPKGRALNIGKGGLNTAAGKTITGVAVTAGIIAGAAKMIVPDDVGIFSYFRSVLVGQDRKYDIVKDENDVENLMDAAVKAEASKVGISVSEEAPETSGAVDTSTFDYDTTRDLAAWKKEGIITPDEHKCITGYFTEASELVSSGEQSNFLGAFNEVTHAALNSADSNGEVCGFDHGSGRTQKLRDWTAHTKWGL